MVKQIALNDMYAFMKENIKSPMTRTQFLRLANKHFDCTSRDSGYFSDLVINRSSDFIRYIAVLAPAGMLKEAQILHYQIINPKKALKTIMIRSRSMHWKVMKAHKENPLMNTTELGALLGVTYGTISFHLKNKCNCRKRKFWNR